MASIPLYENLATRLRGQIRRGVLRPGERMPSLRGLGRQERVSVATAVEAYLQLEREGLVEARERSGYYVRAPTVPAPATRALRLQSRAPQALRNPALLGVLDVLLREDLLPLHVATPALELLPSTAIASATIRAMRRAPQAALDYGSPQGSRDLRVQIAKRYLRAGVDVDPDEIVVTAGAMEAISLALRSVTRSGDVVLLETPTYYGLLQAVAALGLRVIEVPNHAGSGIDVACLRVLLARHAVRAAVLVPNFNNPVGSCSSDADKRAIDQAQEEVWRGKERDASADEEPQRKGGVDGEDSKGHRGHEQGCVQTCPIALPEEREQAASRSGHRDQPSNNPQRCTERHVTTICQVTGAAMTKASSV